jgi:hypothetical protein
VRAPEFGGDANPGGTDDAQDLCQHQIAESEFFAELFSHGQTIMP